MEAYRLRLNLLSDATFGRGDGVAGVLDAEVQHDPTGLPYLAGRTLKGLLGAECADIVFAVTAARPDQKARWTTAADRLFGTRGGALAGEANLRVGPAQLPADLRSRIAQDIDAGQITRAEVLDSITALRRQTAMDAATGAPLENTLRAMRVILRETPFEAELSFQQRPSDDECALLAACVKALRRAGTGRNRGRGKLKGELLDADGNQVTEAQFELFRKAVAP